MGTPSLFQVLLAAALFICRNAIPAESKACSKTILVHQYQTHDMVETALQSYTKPCQIHITAPAGKRIQLNFIKIFNTAMDKRTKLKIYEGKASQRATVRTYTSGMSPYPLSYLSKQNVAELSVEDVAGDSRLFQVQFEYFIVDGCHMIFNLPQGAFGIPDVPDESNGQETCTFHITAKANMKISLVFSEIELGSNPSCNDQRLVIYEGVGENKTLSEVKCLKNASQFLSRTNILTMELKTRKKSAKKLEVYYIAGENGCNKIYSSSSGMIQAPFFPHSLPKHLNCTCQIRAGNGSRILLKSQKFSEPSSKTQVYEGEYEAEKKSVDYPFTFFSYGKYEKPKYVSGSDTLTISFLTGNALKISNQFYYYTSRGCNFDFSFDVGYVGSPRYPLQYQNNEACNYTMRIQKGCTFSVFTDLFRLQKSANCTADNLSIFEGFNRRLLACGDLKRHVVFSRQNKMLLTFRTNENTVDRGFILRHQVETTIADPCSNYDTINDFQGGHTPPQCDRDLVNGWYRFNNSFGGILPDKCPTRDSCGQIWTLKKMPAFPGFTFPLQVCARYKDDCCYDTWSIKARYCSVNGQNFNVYYLRRPMLCFSHCNDDKVDHCKMGTHKCNDNAGCTMVNSTVKCSCKKGYTGTSSCSDINECTMGTHDCDRNAACTNIKGSFSCACNYGYHGSGKKCTATFPLLPKIPLLENTVVKVNGSSVVAFKCKFGSNTNSTDSRYRVSWLITERKLNVKINIATELENLVTLEELRSVGFQLGNLVYCRVDTFFVNTPANKSRPLESVPFFAGFVVVGIPNFVVRETDRRPTEIVIRSTIPVLCTNGDSCSVTVTFVPQQNVQRISLSHCQMELGGRNDSQLKNFVLPILNKIRDGDKVVEIHVRIHKTSGKVERSWLRYRPILKFVIKVQDIPFGYCSSSGDPNVLQFDGRVFSYQQYGDFSLVENRCRNFQVHTRTTSCGAATCDCAVAAREGNDIIIIDTCRGRPIVSFPSSVKVRPKFTTRIRVDSSRRWFVIEFGSGAIVKFLARGRIANIYVTIPSNDFRCTSGLCGNYDGNSNNDGARAHRLAQGTSLFYHQPSQVNCEATDRSSQGSGECVCKSAGGSDPSEVARDCRGIPIDTMQSARFSGYTTIEFPPPKACKKIHVTDNKNVIKMKEKDKKKPYVFTPKPRSFPVPSWPTATGKTLEMARKRCLKDIKNSREGQICSSVASFRFDVFIKQCIEDIKASDSYQFVIDSKNAMITACKEEMYTNTSNWGNSTKPPDKVGEISCPGMCSGNGKCIKGVCSCNAGFQSVDCSVDASRGPDITVIISLDLCDYRQRKDCLVVGIVGSNFMNSDKLSCRIKGVQIPGGSTLGSNREVIVKATLVSFAEIRCDLTDWFKTNNIKLSYLGFTITVSNDGSRFSSNSLLYKIYDSKCMECSNGSCQAKSTTCNINGQCTARCEEDPSDPRMRCVPSKSITKFIKDVEEICGPLPTFPAILQSPVINDTIVRANSSDAVAFKCRFTSNSNSTDARYIVTWLIADTKVKVRNKTIHGFQDIIKLEDLRASGFRLGQVLHCSVQSYYSNTSSVKSQVHMSASFFVGLMIVGDPPFVVRERDRKPLEINIKSTIPILCVIGSRCSVIVTIATKQNSEHITLSQCWLQFEGRNASQVKKILIHPKISEIKYGDKVIPVEVSIQKIKGSIAGGWVDYRPVLKFVVNFKEQRFGICSSTGDPHLTTFDKLYYHHYQPGDYMLVENKCRQFEVHVRTYKCWSVSCNCGIAAREGNDVVVIDGCQGTPRIPRISFPSSQKVQPNNSTKIRVDESGRLYIIEFESGAIIKVWFWGGSNIYVYIPGNDFACTRGLCGNFDGNPNNELIDRQGLDKMKEFPSNNVAPQSFTESWKLGVGTSLFYHKPTKIICESLSQPKPSQNKHEAKKSRFQGYREFQFPATKFCENVIERPTSENVIVMNEEDVIQSYIYNPKPMVTVKHSWPTAKGKTLEGSRSRCLNEIRNCSEGKICNRVESLNFGNFIDQCVEDIKITDGFEFVMAAKNAMVTACQDELYINSTHWVKLPGSKNDNNNNLTLPGDLVDVSCPNFCSGNGKCIQGVCSCNTGFQSVDCSVNVTKGPEIKLIPNQGVCDSRNRTDCLSASVIGSNFMNSRNISCRVTGTQIPGFSKSRSSINAVVNATLISFAEIRCDLRQLFQNGKIEPSTISMKIAVCNDGFRFSTTSLTYTIIDSNCMECSKGSCHAKNATCMINGQCFKQCQSDPQEAAMKCLPSMNTIRFSSDLEGKCQNSSKTVIGNFSFRMDMYKSQEYLNKVASYPVSVKLRDELFLQVSGSKKEGNLVVLIDKCFATQFDNQNQSMKHSLIKKGCQQDSTVRFHLGEKSKQRFSFKVVNFIDVETTMFIHCYAFVCHKQSTNPKCISGCTGNNINRDGTDLDESSTVGGKIIYSHKSHLTRVGPIAFTNQDINEETATGKMASDEHSLTIIIMAVVGGCLIVFIAGVFIKQVRDNRGKLEKQNQDIIIENNFNSTNEVDDEIGCDNPEPDICEKEV